MNIAILIIVILYFFALYIISKTTSKDAGEAAYFRGDRSSPWYVVAFGMIGASLSGVTFISVPGWVGTREFTYLQMVIGYVIGYIIIAKVLIPLYYKENLTSIYVYLRGRFGVYTYRTGSSFFLLSRSVGAAFRLYLVALVFSLIIETLGFSVPFFVPVFISISLIYIYTMHGGIKTIVWTDTLQTACLLLAALLTIIWIIQQLDMEFINVWKSMKTSGYTRVFVWDAASYNSFFKDIIRGAFIALVMTGLDQDMMQKNLTCRSESDAKKNIYCFCIILVFANIIFLFLGGLLYLYGEQQGLLIIHDITNAPLSILDARSHEWINRKTDELYPILALDYLGELVMITFVLGLIAAAYSSADSALTALTTSFCVDFLNFETRRESYVERQRIRKQVQLGFSILLLVMILIFKHINNQAVIDAILYVAGYTYGPLLGLYTFGLICRKTIIDRCVPLVCISSPIFTYFIEYNSENWFGFDVDFLVLPLNGGLTFFGLCLITRYKRSNN